MKKRRHNSALRLAADLLARPARALDRLMEPDAALAAAAKIYIAYLATAVLFYTFKPQGFPPLPADTPVLRMEGGLFFWIKVQAWNPVFTALGIALVGWFAQLMKGGKLAPRLLIAVLCACLPLFVLLAYTNEAFGKAAFSVSLLALVGASVPIFRAADKKAWRPLVALFLSVNTVSIAILPLFLAAVLARAPLMYHVMELVMMFWILGLAAYGVGRIAGLTTARAFCAIFLATLSQIFFIFSLKFLGLIPAGALKAMMTV